MGLMTAMGLISGKKKTIQRPLTPQQKLRLARLRSMRKQRGNLNTDRQGVMQDFETKKRQERIKNSVRNKELSPNTRLLLQRVAEIHNKASRDDNRQQRIVRERRLIQNATDLLQTPNIFAEKRGLIDFTGTENNILQCDSVFKEKPEDFILKKNR